MDVLEKADNLREVMGQEGNQLYRADEVFNVIKNPFGDKIYTLERFSDILSLIS